MLNGHISFFLFGRNITIYGFNAMHVAVNVWTKTWGYVCFHPPMWQGIYWPFYFYVSPNGTPWAATFAIGKGVDKYDRDRAAIRKKKFGHNFNVEENYKELCVINDVIPFAD